MNAPAIPPRYCRICQLVAHPPPSSSGGGGALIFGWLVVILVGLFGHILIGLVLAVPMVVWMSTATAFDRCPRCKNRGTVPYRAIPQQQPQQLPPGYQYPQHPPQQPTYPPYPPQG